MFFSLLGRFEFNDLVGIGFSGLRRFGRDDLGQFGRGAMEEVFTNLCFFFLSKMFLSTIVISSGLFLLNDGIGIVGDGFFFMVCTRMRVSVYVFGWMFDSLRAWMDQ